ncbi:MAG: NAD-dependent epimerase/dehydratase family protein, partial [Armatimonadota bacterium]
MNSVLIAGGSGLIGQSLTGALQSQGVELRRLARRRPARSGEFMWDPARGALDHRALEGADAVVNLAGRSIASGRWTRRARAEILDSRVQSTRLLVEAIGKMTRRPAVLMSASAIGYYGDRGDEVLTESSGPGRGFLVDVVQAWEAEAVRAAAFGVRVVCTRFGIVLSRQGGALGPLLPVFRLGLGGPLGSGRQ